jgi:heat shock protein HspQ
MSERAAFDVGQIIRHRLFGYRGVVIDVDPQFGLSEEWYLQVARSRPPKDRPWYHVLVHGGADQTYVAERNLELDEEASPIEHPGLELHFTGFEAGRYLATRQVN